MSIKTAFKRAFDWLYSPFLFVNARDGKRVYRTKGKSLDVTLYGEQMEARLVLDCTMTFNGLPVRVTGVVTTAPGNWPLILDAPGQLHCEVEES